MTLDAGGFSSIFFITFLLLIGFNSLHQSVTDYTWRST